jgi:outer membrane protein assembly factor BamB
VDHVGGKHVPGFKFSLSDITDNAATITDAKNAIDHLDLTPSTMAAWSMHRHDARNTGPSPYAGPSGPVEKWMFMLPSTVTNASPVISTDGTIYIGNGQSGAGGIFAINPNGSQKWIYPGHTGSCAPAISADGTIYMPGYNDFHAIKPDGTKKWTFWAQDPFNYSSPCIGPDGTIYVGSGFDLLAISPDGQLLWQYRAGGSIESKPAVAPDGTIYVRSRTEYLCAVNPNGSEKWRLELGSRIFGGGLSPVIADNGTLYFGTEDGYLKVVGSM